jgi:DNA adenine methylase
MQTWKADDQVRTPSGLTGRITNIDLTRRVPYCVQWDNGAASWYDADDASKWTKQCSSLTNSSVELVDSVKEPKSPEDSLSETMSISTPTLKPSIDTITQGLPSTQTLELSTQTEEPISSPAVFPVQAQAKLEAEQDLTTQNQDFGLKPCDASLKDDPSLLLSKIQKGLSPEDLDKYLPPSEWQDIAGTIRSSYRRLGSAHRTAETGSSLLPTPTSYSEGSDTIRPAGQNKLEQTLKLLPTPVARDGKGPTRTPNESLTEPIQEFLMGTDKMSSAVPGWMMGFRHGYAEEILMDGGVITPLPTIQECLLELQDVEPVSNSTAEQLCLNKPRSHSAESSISIPSCKPVDEPFLKWAGGKAWAVELVKEFYALFRDYRLVSFCLGGGAIELGLQPERSLLCDINPYLINHWKWVKEDGKFTIPLESREEYFHEIRDRYNENPLHVKAPEWFYLLNHTCFNGLQRGSSKKHFNVGWGKYKKFHGQTDLTHYKSVMTNWEFAAQSWEQTLLQVREDDFMIFDPPYHGTGFKEYYGKFTDDDQIFAAAGLSRLTNPVVAFNEATPEMLELYIGLGFNVQVREVARSISCNGDRTPALEMIATKNLTRPIAKSPTTRTRGRNKAPASGSLSKVGGRTLKNGSKTERWLYSYSEKVNDEWRMIKRHVPNSKVEAVRDAIANKLGYEYICQSLLGEKKSTQNQSCWN